MIQIWPLIFLRKFQIDFSVHLYWKNIEKYQLFWKLLKAVVLYLVEILFNKKYINVKVNGLCFKVAWTHIFKRLYIWNLLVFFRFPIKQCGVGAMKICSWLLFADKDGGHTHIWYKTLWKYLSADDAWHAIYFKKAF